VARSPAVVLSLLSISVLVSTTIASDAGAAQPNTCWSDADLKAKPGERRIQRKRHAYRAPSNTPDLAHFAPVPRTLRGSIRRVDLPENKKWIALTLDFCEQMHEIAGYDGAIIDHLRDQNVAATLFVGGKWMRTHPQRTQQLMADARFELANHAEAHRNLRSLSGRALQREILGPQQVYETLRTKLATNACYKTTNAGSPLPERLTYFRFPYGACNRTALNAVNDAGLLAIQWDFSAWDSARSQSATRIAKRMLRDVRPVSINLGHGNGRGHHTAAALRIAIPKLRKKGYKFVTVSQLLAAGDPVIKQRCYNYRPGDTDRYDRALRRGSKKKVPRGSGIAP